MCLFEMPERKRYSGGCEVMFTYINCFHCNIPHLDPVKAVICGVISRDPYVRGSTTDIIVKTLANENGE